MEKTKLSLEEVKYCDNDVVVTMLEKIHQDLNDIAKIMMYDLKLKLVSETKTSTQFDPNYSFRLDMVGEISKKINTSEDLKKYL